VLISPRASNEEGYLAARLARVALDTNHIDWRTMASTPAAAEAITDAFEEADGDLERAPGVVVVVNGDLQNQTPVTALKIKEFIRRNSAKLVLIGHHHDAWLAPWAAETLHCDPGRTAGLLEPWRAR